MAAQGKSSGNGGDDERNAAEADKNAETTN